MSISSFLDRAVPTIIGYATGGTVGATAAYASVEQEKKIERNIKQQQNLQRQQAKEYMDMAVGLDAYRS